MNLASFLPSTAADGLNDAAHLRHKDGSICNMQVRIGDLLFDAMYGSIKAWSSYWIWFNQKCAKGGRHGNKGLSKRRWWYLSQCSVSKPLMSIRWMTFLRTRLKCSQGKHNLSAIDSGYNLTRYANATAPEKKVIVTHLLHLIPRKNPPGRFLKWSMGEDSVLCYDIGDSKATAR